MTDSAELVEPVAQCLARRDGRFISASDWHAEAGDAYRDRARAVLSGVEGNAEICGTLEAVARTVRRVKAGNRTGGLPTQASWYEGNAS